MIPAQNAAPGPNHILRCHAKSLEALRLVARQRAKLTADPDSAFFALEEAEFNAAIKVAQDELDSQVVLALVASAEAALFRDLQRRVVLREKSAVRQAFTALIRDCDGDPTLRGIIGVWQAAGLVAGKRLDRMIRLTLHRNWLAHGRRWQDKSGIAPDPQDAAAVIREFCLAIPGFAARDLPGG